METGSRTRRKPLLSLINLESPLASEEEWNSQRARNFGSRKQPQSFHISLQKTLVNSRHDLATRAKELNHHQRRGDRGYRECVEVTCGRIAPHRWGTLSDK
ncbi:hypothetical protein I7I51_01260 [Histoplasma capsulatum]|uniref:Uncharacterized protein n=1 Tax=Ajellomyces capsulatus TaxID=5037 RepID=A0A8A1ME81_AJECA|nr:predicted protein [Histoplasma mississippiense (nom. inval.)]EDN10681.1 predicted protein [Histoplasma mississippiense (nom. inval.)]QSS64195.1 hypothetical protein I7I51_01260 [Histoplasma capsulatum]